MHHFLVTFLYLSNESKLEYFWMNSQLLNRFDEQVDIIMFTFHIQYDAISAHHFIYRLIVTTISLSGSLSLREAMLILYLVFSSTRTWLSRSSISHAPELNVFISFHKDDVNMTNTLHKKAYFFKMRYFKSILKAYRVWTLQLPIVSNTFPYTIFSGSLS